MYGNTTHDIGNYLLGCFLSSLHVEHMYSVTVSTGDAVQKFQIREHGRVTGVQHHQGWWQAAVGWFLCIQRRINFNLVPGLGAMGSGITGSQSLYHLWLKVNALRHTCAHPRYESQSISKENGKVTVTSRQQSQTVTAQILYVPESFNNNILFRLHNSFSFQCEVSQSLFLYVALDKTVYWPWTVSPIAFTSLLLILRCIIS